MEKLQESPQNRMGIYLVKEGDCIQSIAKSQNIPPLILLQINHLKAEPVVGSMLVLPQAQGKIYTVKVGESIDSICQQFHLERAEFCQKNFCTYVYPSLQVLI